MDDSVILEGVGDLLEELLGLDCLDGVALHRANEQNAFFFL